MRPVVLVGLLSVVLVATGCPASLREGAYGCVDGRCPAGWFCRSDQLCYSSPAPIDAGRSDAPRLDAPGLDAPRRDAPGLDAPELDAPGLDAPELDAPSVDAPVTPPDVPEDAGAAVDCSVGGTEGRTCVVSGGGAGICCASNCVDPTTDASHCGTCPNACPGTAAFCVGGMCRACRGPADCPADGESCTDAICTTGGVCTQDYIHDRCDAAPTPATGTTDCIGEGVCSPAGCFRGTIADGALCRNRSSQYYCGCGGMCLDADVYCGAMPPYNTCVSLSMCIQAFCNSIGRNCT